MICEAHPSTGGRENSLPEPPADRTLLPLWLSASDAELLVNLCLTSTEAVGERERELFARLGEYLRAFNR